MPLPFYTVLHVTGVILLFFGTGALVMLALLDAAEDQKKAAKKLGSIVHGFGLLCLLVGGFGLLARLGIKWPWPAWTFVKVGLWFFFGASTVLIKKTPHLAKVWFFVLPLIGLSAVFLGVYKPF